MGASNSVSHTAHIDNPNKDKHVLQISQEVLKRIESSKKFIENESTETAKTKQQEAHNISPLEQKLSEINEIQFNKMKEKLDAMLEAKPICWNKYTEVNLSKLRNNLIKCYNEYPKETLHCAKQAKEYTDVVFEEQYKAILKSKKINEEKIEGKLCECSSQHATNSK